jgi:hypothetical protein
VGGKKSHVSAWIFFQNYTGTLLAHCYCGFESVVLSSDSRLVHAACSCGVLLRRAVTRAMHEAVRHAFEQFVAKWSQNTGMQL